MKLYIRYCYWSELIKKSENRVNNLVNKIQPYHTNGLCINYLKHWCKHSLRISNNVPHVKVVFGSSPKNKSGLREA